MRRFSLLLILLIFISCTGCNDGNGNNTTYSKFSNPDTVLNYFFEACASMDSVVLDSLSVVANYPLVTEWKIRRIDNQSKYLSFSEMEDSVNVLKSKSAELDTNMKSLKDKIDHDITTASTVNEKYEKYTQAEIAWENAELVRIRKGLPTNYKPTKILEKEKNDLHEEYLAAFKYYEEFYPKAQERLENKLSILNLKNKHFEYIGLKLELLIKMTAFKKSGIVLNPPPSCQTCLTHAFVDLKIPSKLGIMLNKKVRVELFSADCTNKQAKWIITEITYLGEGLN